MANSAYFTFQQSNLVDLSVNLKYKNKSTRLKKLIKNLVFENAALCDHVAQIQENILCRKEERRFLFKKLLEHDPTLITEKLPAAGGKKSKNKKRSNSEANNKTAKKPSSPTNDDTQRQRGAANQQIIQTISVDEIGRPIYPINMGYLSIHDLGEIIVDRPTYHTDSWIYPVGFLSTRIYGHIKDPEQKCVYTCKIVDGGEYPRFEIIPDSDMEYAIAGPSPDLCHAALLQTINNSSDARHIDVRPQGEWFFGLGHPTVMMLLQSSPNAHQCTAFNKVDSFSMDLENDATVNYDALQRHIAVTTYHTVPEIKEEPPDELFEQTG